MSRDLTKIKVIALLKEAIQQLEAADVDVSRVRVQIHGSNGTFSVTVKPDKKTSVCRRCGEAVLRAKTAKGKNMPLDVPADPQGVYTSHFATCSGGEG